MNENFNSYGYFYTCLSWTGQRRGAERSVARGRHPQEHLSLYGLKDFIDY